EARGGDQLVVSLAAGGALLGAERLVVGVVQPLGRDRDRVIVRHRDRLVVEGDVVVGILPGRRRRGRAALGVDAGVVLERLYEAFLDLGVVDEGPARIVDQLYVVGIGPAQERLERVGRFHAHRAADAVDALARGLAQRRLHLVAPERPVCGPVAGDVVFLEAGLRQHVL